MNITSGKRKMLRPFNAIVKTMSISVTSTASTAVNLPAQGNTLRVSNEGTSTCYISLVGSATVPSSTPALTCTTVLAGTDITLTIPNDSIYQISAICRSGNSTIIEVAVSEGN